MHGASTQTLTYTANSNRTVTHDGNTVSRDAAGNATIDPAENVSFTYGTHNRSRSKGDAESCCSRSRAGTRERRDR